MNIKRSTQLEHNKRVVHDIRMNDSKRYIKNDTNPLTFIEEMDILLRTALQ